MLASCWVDADSTTIQRTGWPIRTWITGYELRANTRFHSASEKMLVNMRRGYGVDDVREALDCLSDPSIPFGPSILLGAPGETRETIRETFDVIDRYPMVRGMWVNIGIYLWTHHQKVLEAARQDGQLRNDRELFAGAYFIAPELAES